MYKFSEFINMFGNSTRTSDIADMVCQLQEAFSHNKSLSLVKMLSLGCPTINTFCIDKLEQGGYIRAEDKPRKTYINVKL